MPTTSTFDALIDSPDAASVRALIYLAWNDGILEAHEFQELREVLSKLSESIQGAATPWLRPEAPPSIRELHRLRRKIREDLRAADPHQPLPEEHELLLQTTGLDLLRLQRNLVGEHPAGTHQAPTLTAEEHRLSDELRLMLEGDSQSYWADVAAQLDTPEFRQLNAPTTELYREQVLQWVQNLANAGFGTRLLTPESGTIDFQGAAQTFAALSTFDLSLVVKFGVQFGLFGGSIYFLGSEEHHKELLPRIARGEVLGGFAMTESGHGSDVNSIETTATFDRERDGFIIHSPTRSAWKEWIGNAARDGEAMTVFAQLYIDDESYGVHAFYVPIRDGDGAPLPGVHVEDCGHKMGLNGVDNGRIAFDEVFIPRANLLSRYAQVDQAGNYQSEIRSENARFFTMLGTLIGGRLSVALGAVTAARMALMVAIRYGASRRQFGPADGEERVILDYPTHQERLLPPLAHGMILHIAMNDLLAKFESDDGHGRRHLEGITAGMKAICTWYAIDATQAAREGCGGQGYLSINRIAAIRRDVDVFATFEGDNVVLMNLLAKNYLTGYARGFQHDLTMTMIRELGRLAGQTIIDRNPVVRRQTDEEHLRSSDYQIRALELRANSLLSSAARRIKKRTDAGMDPFDAFHDIQDHLQAMVRAGIEHHVAHVSYAWIREQPEGAAKNLLEQCRQLAAIDVLHKNTAWYLENNFIEAQKARAIRKLRMKIILELRDHALVLANAITHAEKSFASPIAQPN